MGGPLGLREVGKLPDLMLEAASRPFAEEKTEGGWAPNHQLVRSAGSKGCASLHVLQQWLLLPADRGGTLPCPTPCLASTPCLVLQASTLAWSTRWCPAWWSRSRCGCGPSAPRFSRLLAPPGFGACRQPQDAVSDGLAGALAAAHSICSTRPADWAVLGRSSRVWRPRG